MQKKSKIIIISVVSAILLVVGVFAAIALTGKGNSIEKEVGEKLSLGQKFLLDLEYDKAVAEFQAVIDIEPKNADAYIGLADAYIGMGEEEKAIETLEKGLSETGDETIRAKLDEMKTPEETTAEVTTTPEETTTAPKGPRTERYDYSDGSYCISEYDSKGKWIKSSLYNADGILDCYYTYEYYSYPYKFKKAYKYLPDGTFDSYSLFEYYESGYTKKQTWYYQSGGEGWHDWEDGEAYGGIALW